MIPTTAQAAVELAARASYGRLVAILAAPTGDLALAEDALADAFERALATWPRARVPDNRVAGCSGRMADFTGCRDEVARLRRQAGGHEDRHSRGNRSTRPAGGG